MESGPIGPGGFVGGIPTVSQSFHLSDATVIQVQKMLEANYPIAQARELLEPTIQAILKMHQTLRDKANSGEIPPGSQVEIRGAFPVH